MYRTDRSTFVERLNQYPCATERIMRLQHNGACNVIYYTVGSVDIAALEVHDEIPEDDNRSPVRYFLTNSDPDQNQRHATSNPPGNRSQG